jgi:hypothetical protein
MYCSVKTSFRQAPTPVKEVSEICVYLSHVAPEVRKYILKETGYSSLVEYELLSGDRNGLTIIFDNDRVPTCEPYVDTGKNVKTFDLLLSHFSTDVQDRLCQYMGLDALTFELEYAGLNTFPFVVEVNPNPKETFDINECLVSLMKQALHPKTTEKAVSQEDVKTVVAEETKTPVQLEKPFVVKQEAPVVKQLFSGWTARLNPVTKNSYVLVAEDVDSLPDKSWQIEGVHRPIYYSDIYKGWIIGLRYEDFIRSNGVTFVDA